MSDFLEGNRPLAPGDYAPGISFRNFNKKHILLQNSSNARIAYR